MAEVHTLDELKEFIIINIDSKFRDYVPSLKIYFEKMLSGDISLGRTLLHINLKTLYGEVYNGPVCSMRMKQFYLVRGWTEEDALNEVSNIQKSNTPRSINYWKSRGHSEEEAIQKVSDVQKQYGEISRNKYTGIERRKISYRCFEHWIEKGYTEEEAKKIISLNSDSGSMQHFLSKYNTEEEAVIKYKENCKSKSLAQSGSNNHQFGKPSPKGSGNGISGYYKNYYFRSLLEYKFIKMMEEYELDFICNDVNISTLPEKVTIKLPSGRTYTPDFLVGDDIVEVKSFYNLTSKDTLAKIDVGLKFVAESKIHDSYLIFTEKNIIHNDKNTIIDYDSGSLTIDDGKKLRFLKILKTLRNKNHESYIKESC